LGKYGVVGSKSGGGYKGAVQSSDVSHSPKWRFDETGKGPTAVVEDGGTSLRRLDPGSEFNNAQCANLLWFQTPNFPVVPSQSQQMP